MSHEDHLAALVEKDSILINFPEGTRVIVKNNSSTPYKTGTLVGVQVFANQRSAFPLVDIDGAEKNPHMVMGIMRKFDERRNKALDKLTGIEQWNVMAKHHVMDEDEHLVCDDCGEKKSDAVETVCPFASEIHNETIHVTLCDACYHERCMDI